VTFDTGKNPPVTEARILQRRRDAASLPGTFNRSASRDDPA